VNDLALPGLMPGWNAVLTTTALVVALLALVVAAVAVRRERRMAAHYAALMTGADGTDLAAGLHAFSRRLDAAEGRIVGLEGQVRAVDTARVEAAEGRLADLDARLRRALQRVHLVRYRAFEDGGGDQSFALALLDDARDGVVVSALSGRGGTRVYAKPVDDGRSSYNLTEEEAQAVASAGEAPR
jgi:hypothetical protein